MRSSIEDYALIGDLRTGALLGADGSIDWLSLPRFDSPAVYTALLGTHEHGHWALAPAGKQRCTRRRYRPNTLILETEWTTGDGVVRVTDFMDPTSSTPQVIRIVDGVVGKVRMHTTVAPRMNYGSTRPSMRRTGKQLVATDGPDALWLDSEVFLRELDGAWAGQFTVAAGQRVTFTLSYAATAVAAKGAHTTPSADPARQLAATDAYWTEWTSRSTYTGPWAGDVTQSLIFLKALTYAPTGSILAAATTSLPEQVGGSRNWDYRFSWLRDAAFTVQAFLATGYLEEATAWRDWLLDAVADDPAIQIMYGIDGTRQLPEQTLHWLPGHAGSSPVRIGNAAFTQQQNDVWGEVLHTLEAMQEAGVPVLPAEQELRETLLDHLLRSWRQPDHGLWEIRGPRRHFVHSKAMAWVGVDRSVQALERLAGPDPLEIHQDRLQQLRTLRTAIRTEIINLGFDPARRAFMQSYGSATATGTAEEDAAS